MRRNLVLSVVASSVVSTALTALIFTMAMPGLVAAQVDTIRGGQVIAVGDNGERVRITPGPGAAASVRIVGTDGQDRVIMTQGTDTDAGFGVRTAGGVNIMRLGTVANDPELAGPLLHSANLILRDDSGGDRIRLLISDAGNPTIELINAAGELVWSAP